MVAGLGLTKSHYPPSGSHRVPIASCSNKTNARGEARTERKTSGRQQLRRRAPRTDPTIRVRPPRAWDAGEGQGGGSAGWRQAVSLTTAAAWGEALGNKARRPTPELTGPASSRVGPRQAIFPLVNSSEARPDQLRPSPHRGCL